MTKVGHTALKEEFIRNPDDELYAKAMAELKKENKPTTVKKLTAEEILAMQPESTRRAMTTDPEKRWAEPILGWKAVPDAKSQDEAVAMRSLKPDEVDSHKKTQRSRNQHGDSKESSISKEKRTKGIEAFTYSQPVDLSTLTQQELKKITKLEEIKSTPLEPITPLEPEIKKSTLSKVGAGVLFVIDLALFPIDWTVRRVFKELD